MPSFANIDRFVPGFVRIIQLLAFYPIVGCPLSPILRCFSADLLTICTQRCRQIYCTMKKLLRVTTLLRASTFLLLKLVQISPQPHLYEYNTSSSFVSMRTKPLLFSREDGIAKNKSLFIPEKYEEFIFLP